MLICKLLVKMQTSKKMDTIFTYFLTMYLSDFYIFHLNVEDTTWSQNHIDLLLELPHTLVITDQYHYHCNRSNCHLAVNYHHERYCWIADLIYLVQSMIHYINPFELICKHSLILSICIAQKLNKVWTEIT